MNLYKNTVIALLLVLCLSPSLTCASSEVPDDYRIAIEQVVAGLNARDPDPYIQAVDADRILNTALSGILLEPAWEKAFRRGARRGLTTESAKQMIQLMPEGGYAKLLRIKMNGDIGQALIRVDLGTKGNGYMDMHLARVDGGGIKIVDWYSYATGELCSDTFRQTVVFASPTPTLLGKIFDIASDRKKNSDLLLQLVAMRGRGEHEQMARKFLTLDEELRKSRLLNMFAFQSANMTDDIELYRKVLTNIERYFHDDESLAFVLIDYYYLEGDQKKVVETADRLQALFGVEDAGLTVIKANAMLEMGSAREAAAQTKHAIELEPEYEYAYLSLINAQVSQKLYAQAVSTANILEQRFSYDLSPEALADNEFFAGFVASAEYVQWRDGR